MAGTPKKPKSTTFSPESVEKYGEMYKYKLKGYCDQEQVELLTDSPSKLEEGRRRLWKTMYGSEPPVLS